VTASLDHLVVTAPVLADGVAWVEATLGVAMQPGGRHPRMGTHNAVLRLGGETYLEVVAIDPNAPRPPRPRWFGLDALGPGDPPTLRTWVARTDDLEALVASAMEPPGEILAMERGPFRWRIAVPADGRPPLDGLAPALIAWSTTGPAPGLDDHGLRLAALEARHPDPERVRRTLAAVGLGDTLVVAPTAPGDRPGLVARFETPAGRRSLGGGA
jgi:hypothetical protein